VTGGTSNTFMLGEELRAGSVIARWFKFTMMLMTWTALYSAGHLFY
jgi:hypothetical protein